MRSYEIELHKKRPALIIPVVQYDTDRTIRFEVTDEDLTAGSEVRLYVRKPSGKEVYNKYVVTDNGVTVALSSQTLAESGEHIPMQLQFKKSESAAITTFIFYLNIEKSLVSDMAIESKDEFNIFDSYLQEARKRLNDCQDQLTNMKNQASLIGDGNIGTSTSSRHTLPTSEGAAALRELPGVTEQVTTTGAQLFDASRLPTKSQSGVTITNNGDGSFTFSGTGTMAERVSYNYILDHNDFVKLFHAGDITIKVDKSTKPYILAQIYAVSQRAVFVNLTTESRNTMTATILPEWLSNPNIYVVIAMYIEKGDTVIPGTIRPMLYQDGDGTWEPYTGGNPGPNPDYPQRIQGIGDSGWFDGELLQGSYDSETGKFTSSKSYVCNANKIFCKAADKIELIYEESVYFVNIIFYSKNDTMITKSSALNKNKVVGIAPAGTAYCNIILRQGESTEFSPGAAKHITVLKNGKYAVQVMSCTKNMLPPVSTDYGWINETSIKRYRKTVQLKQGITYIISTNTPKVSSGGNYVVYFRNTSTPICQGVNISYAPSEDEIIDIYVYTEREHSNDVLSGKYYIQLEEGSAATEFQPYKESAACVELDQPLYAGDKIYMEDGHLWLYRENAVVEYDGSTDEAWEAYRTLEHKEGLSFCININEKQNGVRTSLCTHFANVSPNYAFTSLFKDKLGIYSDHPEFGYIYFRRPNAETVTVEQWRTWLASHPITVVYKLAAPTKTQLNQPSAYGLRTYGEQTHIYIPDALEPEFSIDYPLNPAGGYALDGFCQSRINEINRQALDDRISKIEVDLGSNTFIVE